MKKAIFTLLLSSITFFAFSQWYWVNPSPIGYTLYDVCFVDQTTGYVVGEKGTVLKTVDCGENWIPLNTGTLRNFNMVTFLNANTGYIVAGKYLMKTTDGGQSWTDIETGAEQSFSDMFFIDENKGFLSGAAGSLLRTTDGGVIWTQALIPDNKYVNSIWFPTETTGYAACSMGTVMKTINGGLTWTAIINQNMLEMKDVFFIDENTGFVAGEQGFSMRTTNGGMNWTSTGSNYNLKELYFINGLTGYAISGSSLVKTTNAGTTWTSVGMDDIWSFDFINENIVFGTGSAGRLFKSTDQGVTSVNFNPSVTYDDFTDIHFPDEITGYAVTYGGEIIKTIDAGNSWSVISLGQFNKLISVWFTDINTGYVLTGTTGFKTVDAGITWNEMALSGTGSYLFEIMFVNGNTGFIGGQGDGLILRTDDAGNTWQIIYQEQEWPRAMHFLDQDTGYVALTSSVIKTTDGGNTWTEFTGFDPANLFFSMFFINTNVGFVGSYINSKLYKTIDGGETWSDLSDTTRFYPVQSLFFTTETTGYMVSNYLYQTNDGGYNWVRLNYISAYSTNIWFTDDQTGYLAGHSGSILKTTNAGAVPVVSPDKPASEFTLYPNPANNEVTINSNTFTGKVNVSIYNSSGSCVFDEILEGKTIKINTSFLKAGLYLVRINTLKGTEMKKLVIL